MRTFILLRWHLLLIFVFCLSLLISSHTALGTSRFPHELWFSLYLFCGPLRGGGDFLLLPHAIRRLWEVQEAVSGLWPTHRSAFPPVILSLCCLEGAALGPYLTWAPATECLLVPHPVSPQLPAGALGLSGLLPVDPLCSSSLRDSGEHRWGAAQL